MIGKEGWEASQRVRATEWSIDPSGIWGFGRV